MLDAFWMGCTTGWLVMHATDMYRMEYSIAQQSANSVWWVQGLKEIDAYLSDPTKEKSSGRKSGGAYGPEMLETWLLLEFCDR